MPRQWALGCHFIPALCSCRPAALGTLQGSRRAARSSLDKWRRCCSLAVPVVGPYTSGSSPEELGRPWQVWGTTLGSHCGQLHSLRAQRGVCEVHAWLCPSAVMYVLLAVALLLWLSVLVLPPLLPVVVLRWSACRGVQRQQSQCAWHGLAV